MKSKNIPDISLLRNTEAQVVAIGSHPGILQSVLDFDCLAGKKRPSIRAIIAGGRRHERYFWGKEEVLIPVYDSPAHVPSRLQHEVNLFINLMSGRRVLASTQQAIEAFGSLRGGTIFAEDVPERHALELYNLASVKDIWIVGGASVGMLVPGNIKLGAIGGIEAKQLIASKILDEGQIAVIASSGGMVNEIIRLTAASGFGLSFAIALGGEYFPVMTPKAAFLAAERDSKTKAIVYFGEIGGTDEYEVAELIKTKQVTKPVVAYIAGVVAELFKTPPQFGHAKAMANSHEETADAKRELLERRGVLVGKSFGDFVHYINGLSLERRQAMEKDIEDFSSRKKGLIASSVSYDEADEVQILGQDLLGFIQKHSFAYIASSMFLGKPLKSKDTEEFVDFVLRILVDHGPYVSGAVNTIVTARAGKDLMSSLAAGILTIGSRFGGAINDAAAIWIKGVKEAYRPAQLVEEFAGQKQYIAGIGHRKYRADKPDPRVQEIVKLTGKLKSMTFTDFAKGVEAETLQKKANLILNVDGAIAAGLLDMLKEKEGYSIEELEHLVETGFFNAFFVLSRSVGLMAHYFDQVRLDEGLFRLDEDQVTRVRGN